MNDEGDEGQNARVKLLSALLVNGAVASERRGFSPSERHIAAQFVETTLRRRRPKTVSTKLESFTDKSGRRLMRTAIANDNMPFLVDSVAAILARYGLVITRLLHPVIAVERDDIGLLTSVGEGAHFESLIYIECERGDARARAGIRQDIQSSLTAVRAAVTDWADMRAALQTDVSRHPQSVSGRFLAWGLADHFTLLGTADVNLKGRSRNRLGIAQLDMAELLPSALLAQALTLFQNAETELLIAKSDHVSAVHRAVPIDLMIVPLRRGPALVGVRFHAILWTSAALAASAKDVPILAERLTRLHRKYRFAPASHAAKALTHAATILPHDLAVSMAEADFERLALTAMSLADRPRIEVELVRAPLSSHFHTFVWLPRDELSTARRLAIAEMLTTDGYVLVNWAVTMSDGVTALLRFVIDQGVETKLPDQIALRRSIETIVRGWPRLLESALAKKVEKGAAARLALRYAHHFPLTYREKVPVEEAAADVLALVSLCPGSRTVRIFRRHGDLNDSVRLSLYMTAPIALSDTVPVLENFGFRVFDMAPTVLDSDHLGLFHTYQLGLETEADPFTLHAQSEQIETAIANVIANQSENDRFNGLMVAVGLEARAVLLFRSLFRYMRQTGLTYSVVTVVDALRRHPALTRMLVSLFDARFDPGVHSESTEREWDRRITRALQSVLLIDDDRILRQLRSVIGATVRTNMFGPAGQEALAFKIDSAKIPGLPLPTPWREIFVYSPRVEGIHLRAGPIARGGLRWSDRRDDYRTEILALMKAQRVKNAVIVPTGAKGGFFPKHLPDATNNREAWLAEGTECYRIFIRALLSVTDNLIKSRVIQPSQTICHDDDDPYFVVAADKGTASFSDIANAIALEQGFWLGDAFASGGSVGYDHKAMGITAKGAWISVRRHFAEAGINIQKDIVRVAGCGDMSGDVFGNAMLLSKAIALVAAFDHRHIFIDPSPNPARSWKERERLFKLPRSSWADYDPRLISKGGGVFSRSAKSLALSKEMRACLGVEARTLEPSALIAAILKSPVDLLWFGGIGTYVKARAQSNGDVGDRSNEAHRIDAEELRCRVIGEGANLGMTQAARIAFGLNGGRINTDFIDNSAGVDCSDNEVNIKIALQSEIDAGRMKSAARNRLLTRMTGGVSALVLENNRLQVLALSIAHSGGVQDLPALSRIMETLERRELLNRAVEGLAAPIELRRRASEGQGLTRPELAVLLATAKLALQKDIESTSLGQDAATTPDLISAFPIEMQQKHRAALMQHPLRGEIIATRLANRIINRMGVIHPFELAEEEAVSLGKVAEAFVVAEQVFSMARLWADIDTADITETSRLMLFEQVSIGMRAHMADILRNGIDARSNDLAILAYRPTISILSQQRDALLPSEARRHTKALAERLSLAGAPRRIIEKIALLAELDGAIGLSALAMNSAVNAVTLTRAFTRLGQACGIDWAQGAAMQLDPEEPWERLLAAGLARDFQTMRLEFLGRIGGKQPDVALGKWIETHQERLSSLRALITRARNSAEPSPAMLAQIAGQARALLARS